MSLDADERLELSIALEQITRSLPIVRAERIKLVRAIIARYEAQPMELTDEVRAIATEMEGERLTSVRSMALMLGTYIIAELTTERAKQMAAEMTGEAHAP